MPCKPQCKHNFKDERYDGKRVFNKGVSSNKDVEKFRCTVCGEEKNISKGKSNEST